MGTSPVVIVKFHKMRNPAEQRSSIHKLVGGDCSQVDALFPDSDEPQLATMFELRLKDDASVKQVLDKLSRDDEIEYAHEPEERRPL